MEEQQLDVNQGASSEPIVETQEPQSSAETENTGNEEFEFPKENPGWPEGVYERFKGVNEKKKALEAQFAELSEKHKPFEENLDKLQAYGGFDQIIQQHPQLWNSIQEQWKQYFGIDQMTPEQMQLLQTNEALQNTNQSLSQMVVGNYQRDFDGWYKDSGYPTESKDAVMGVAQNIMAQTNPNWQTAYNPQSVGKVLEQVKQQVDGFLKSNMSSYIQQKKQTVPQTASRGTAQSEGTSKFESRDEFVERIKQAGTANIF